MPKTTVSNIIVGSGGNHHKPARLVLIILCLGLVIGAPVLWYVYGGRDEKPKRITICAAGDDSLASQAAKALQAEAGKERAEQLQPVVQKIQATDKHEQDIDCLYPLVAYYIARSDTTGVDRYYTQLQEVYQPGDQFSGLYEESGVDHMWDISEQVRVFREQKNSIPFQGVYFTPEEEPAQ